MDQVPLMVCADQCGRVFEHPGYLMAGMSGRKTLAIHASQLIPLPPGSDLLVMPGRAPVGIDRETGEHGHLQPHFSRVDHVDGIGGVQAVAAFPAPGYTRFLNPAFAKSDPDAPLLPLYGYTAVGWMKGRFWVPASRIDPDVRQDPCNFNLDELPVLVSRRLGRNPDNGLLHHLANCALENGCPAARNLFYGRWEAPLPTSPACNASCLGCISEQPEHRTQTFQRIRRAPTAQEVAGVAVPHLKKAERPVVSFGQGCEGEPLLQGALLEESIRLIRAATDRGVINLNTNASKPRTVEALCKAGLNAMRVSLNSANEPVYNAYYQPRGYCLDDVLESIKIANDYEVWVSINYLIFPGVSDTPKEIEALRGLLGSRDVNLIQWRNLNIDPDLYLGKLEQDGVVLGDGMGIDQLLEQVRNEYPRVQFGYFNPPREDMSPDAGTRAGTCTRADTSADNASMEVVP